MTREKRHPDDLTPGPTRPRRFDLMAELERMDQGVRLAGEDEWKTCFDRDCHPKGFHMGLADPTEPVADKKGNLVDMETHSQGLTMGQEIGSSRRDSILEGLAELDYARLRETDVTDPDLTDIVDLQRSTQNLDDLLL